MQEFDRAYAMLQDTTSFTVRDVKLIHEQVRNSKIPKKYALLTGISVRVTDVLSA